MKQRPYKRKTTSYLDPSKPKFYEEQFEIKSFFN